jgi:hypothetical protein
MRFEMATKALLTSDEFEQIVSRLPEDRRWELIRGELYEVSPSRSGIGGT